MVNRVRRRVFLRLIPWLFLLYIVAYLDRANVTYATLEMSPDLGFSPKVYGFGAGIFFVGYFLLEIPGAVIAVRWGVRRWICRIMVSWGIVAVGMGFIHNATQFYWLRFLLGLAEAGFFPAIIIYLSTWFTAQDRAKAIGVFMSASAAALAIGGPISAFLMKADWLGLHGWRWLFILEGAPAVVLGIVSLFIMTDRPSEARWLTAEERACLENELAADRRRQIASGGPPISMWQALGDARVLILAGSYFCGMLIIYGIGLWLPTIVKSASGLSTFATSFVAALPFVLAVCGKIFAGWSSDHFQERRWHAVTAMCLAAAGLVGSALAAGNFPVALACIALGLAGAHAFATLSWAYTTSILGGTAAAAAVGFINSVGNLGGFVGPNIMGWTRERGDNDALGVLVLAGSALLGALLIFSATLVRRKERAADAAGATAEQSTL